MTAVLNSAQVFVWQMMDGGSPLWAEVGECRSKGNWALRQLRPSPKTGASGFEEDATRVD